MQEESMVDKNAAGLIELWQDHAQRLHPVSGPNGSSRFRVRRPTGFGRKARSDFGGGVNRTVLTAFEVPEP